MKIQDEIKPVNLRHEYGEDHTGNYCIINDFGILIMQCDNGLYSMKFGMPKYSTDLDDLTAEQVNDLINFHLI